MPAEFALKVGTKYWLMAEWTSGGVQVRTSTWDGGFIDTDRLKRGDVYLTESAAQTALKEYL